MNTILVLATGRRHFKHYTRRLTPGPDVEFYTPFSEEGLRGIRPIAIIELDEWWIGKSEAFLEHVDHIKRSMMPNGKHKNP